MALVLKDRVRETTTTTGTGTITLAGAVTGFQTFTSVLSNGDTTYYCITDGTDFEVGEGTFTTSGTTLERNEVLESSNSGNKVDWGAGTRDVFITQPAEKAVFLDFSDVLTLSSNIDAAGNNIVEVEDIGLRDRIFHDGDTDTYLQFSAANSFRVVTGNSERLFINNTSTIFNENGSDVDFRVEGDTNANLLFVDAGNDRVGIGQATPATLLDVNGTITATDLDISGDVDVDGTLEADAITLNGTSLAASATTDTTNAANISSGTLPNARLDQQLQDVAGLAVTNGNFIVGDGSNFVAESGSTARSSLGLGTAAVLNTGISNTNVPKFTTGVADNDFLRVDGTAIEGRSASEVLSDIGGQASLTFGIANTNAVKIDSTSVADDEYARFTANGLESRSTSEVLSDIGAITATSTDTLTNKTINASQLSGTVANARLDAQLQDVAGLAVTDGGFIVGDGSNFVLETGSTARTSLGLGTAAVLDTGISNTNVPKFTSGVADNDFLRVDGTAIEGRSASEVLSDIGAQASLTFGISNTNAVKIDSTSVADDEYARFTANGLESRSTSEVLSDIGAQASLTFGISNTNAVKIDSSSVADDEFARFTANGLESRSASEVRSDIGLGTIATQAADSVNIDGGAIDGVTLGTNSAVTEAQIDNINIDGNSITSTDTNGNLALQPNGTGDILLNADTVRVGDSNANVAITTNGTGDLTLNTNSGTNSGSIVIADAANGNITITPNGTGDVVIDGLNYPQADGSAGQFLKTDGSGQLSFATVASDLVDDTSPQLGGNLDVNGNEITSASNGNVVVNPNGTGTIELEANTNVTGTLYASSNIGLDSTDYISFTNNTQMDVYLNGNNEFRFEADGDFHADGDVIGFSTTVSDERLKSDIAKIDGAVDKLEQLNGYTFTYTADGKQSAGVIAQEVEKVLPSAVSEKELPLKTDDGIAYKTVQYDQLHALLIEAVKELSARVKELEDASRN